ncbi:uncharacterized protein [Typha angustifolia]|uniref:uncharacterized protein n=1 Tax=Typha angustifolia TaxID=59011 RepID=UPI003C2FA531
MGSRVAGGKGRRACTWSVFDAVRSFPSSPDSLMSEIEAAIASYEYTHSTSFLSSSSSSPSKDEAEGKDDVSHQGSRASSAGDARLADDAYKAACTALAAGNPGAAIRSLHVAIASCPPDKTSALAKLRSLLSAASSQLHRQHQK